MDNNDYTKMYLVPPEVLKKLQQEESLNSELDQSMYKIAKMGKMDIMQKWLLYRQQLSKYMNKKRNSASVAASSDRQTGLTFDRGVQTASKLKKSAKNPSTTTMPVQTDGDKNNYMDGEIAHEMNPERQMQEPDVGDDDAISQLTPPTSQLETRYDAPSIAAGTDNGALNDELHREQEASDDMNFTTRRKKAVKKTKVVSESHDGDDYEYDSDVQIVESTKPVRLKKTSTRKPATRRKVSRSRSTTDAQTGSGNKKIKTIKWICTP